MDEVTYSNREIREFLDDIHKTLDRIEAQTTKTNGRVSHLEGWRSYTAGAIAIMVLIVIPIVGFLMVQIINIGNTVSENSAIIRER